MKRFLNIALTILLFVVPCVAVENKDYFNYFIIIWPLIAFALVFINVWNFNKIDYKKANKGLIAHKFDNEERDNISEIINDIKITNSATDGIEEKKQKRAD